MSAVSSTWGASQRFRIRPASAKVEQVKGVLFYYLLGLLFVAFLCSLFYIWSRIQIVNLGYSINREITLKEQLQDEQKRLSLEVASLKSPIRLEGMAKNELKMDLPQKSQILTAQPVIEELVKNDTKAEVKGKDKKNKVLSESSKKTSPLLAKKISEPKNKTLAKNSSLVKSDSKKLSLAKKDTSLKKDTSSSKSLSQKTTQKLVQKDSKLKSAPVTQAKNSSSSSKKVTAISDKKTQKIASIAGISPHR